MIFENIKSLKAGEDIQFFMEKIDLVIRIMEVYCVYQKGNLNDFKGNTAVACKELQDMGVVNNKDDLNLLEIILKNDYLKLIKALSYYSNNKAESNFILNKFYNTYRLKKQFEVTKNTDSSTVVDLFSGAGGFSLGFVQEGFVIKLANDHEKVCNDTYMINHPEISSRNILHCDIKAIVNNINKYVGGVEIDVVIGGPPCQSFSNANRQRTINDPRNILYKYFVQAVDKLKPKFFVMENVRGMRKISDQVKDDFRSIGYSVDAEILDASTFSVPQKRERLIFIGNRLGISPKEVFDQIFSQKNADSFILKDALEYIKPLEACRIKGMTDTDCEKSGKKVDFNSYYGKSNQYLDLINEGRKIAITFNHKARYNSEIDRKRYALMKQGDDSISESIAHIIPYKHRSHIFQDKYYKLVSDKPCKTITAHMKMDCHSHIHPTQVRSLTPREAARIQAYPDDYIFMGPFLKTYMQIGNSVSPLMGRVIAKSIKSILDRNAREKKFVYCENIS